MEFYVIVSHSFDAETYIYKVNNETEATDLLEWLWEDYYNNEIVAESHLNERECFHEDDYARVTWDDGDYTEFQMICGLDSIPKEFYERR